MERELIAPNTVYADPGQYGAVPARPVDRLGRLWTLDLSGPKRRLVLAPDGARQHKFTGTDPAVGYLVLTIGTYPDVREAYGDENGAADAIETYTVPDLTDDTAAAERAVADLEAALPTNGALKLAIAYTPAWKELWSEHSGRESIKIRQRKQAQQSAEREETDLAERWAPVRDRLTQLGVGHTPNALTDIPHNRLTVRYTRKDAVTSVNIPVGELARLLLFVDAPTDDSAAARRALALQVLAGEGTEIAATSTAYSRQFRTDSGNGRWTDAHSGPDGQPVINFYDLAEADVDLTTARRALADAEHRLVTRTTVILETPTDPPTAVMVYDGEQSEPFTPFDADALMKTLTARIAAIGRAETVRFDPVTEQAIEGQAATSYELEQRAGTPFGRPAAGDDVLIVGTTGSGKTAMVRVHTAFAAANAHIAACTICHPKMRLPEMCAEGQRLTSAAVGGLPTIDDLTAAAVDEDGVTPTPLRWGLNDVEWVDDGSVIVCMSDADGHPYTLELEEDRARVLRQDLAGPEAADEEEHRATALHEILAQVRANNDQIAELTTSAEAVLANDPDGSELLAALQDDDEDEDRCGAMDPDDLDACGHCPDCTGLTAALASDPSVEQRRARRSVGSDWVFTYDNTRYEVFVNTGDGPLYGTYGVRSLIPSAFHRAAVDGRSTPDQAKADALADFMSFDGATGNTPEA
jgi:hypothetical protein